MEDVKVLLAVIIAIAALGFRMEVAPSKVATVKDPVERIVKKQMAKEKKAAAEAAAMGGEASTNADGTKKDLDPRAKSAAIVKKDRAAGGDMDKSTEKALREIEDHNLEVQKTLQNLPFGGGSDDDDKDDDNGSEGESSK